ncbi:MAG TPA: AsmA family protein, partial [Rhodospirillales bacterium]|nr:AsmA family protein [Rhodospirillales bacterium]
MSKAVKILSAIGVLLVALVVAGIAILKSIDFNQYKDVIAEQAKAATGRELTIAGDLSLSLSLSPRVSVQGVTFANAPWGSDPVMLSVKRFAAEMSLIPLLSGEIEIKQVILEGVNVLAEKDKSGQANWDFGPPAPANQAPAASTSEADVVLPVINNVSLKDVNVTYKDAQAGLEYSLNLGTVDLKSGGLDAPLDLVILGAVNDQAFAIKGQLGSIGAIGGGQVFPVKLNIAALKMDVGLDGKIGVPNGNPMVDLRLKVDGNSLVETLKAVAALEPALTGLQLPVKGAFSLNTILKLDGPAKIALTDLQAAIGSLNIKGRVSADLGGARPNVDATLQMATLNLDDLLPKNDTGAASGRARIDDGRVFPADPLPLEGLKAADANVKLTIDKVIIDGMEIANLKVNLALENGRLNLDLVNAGVADGKINGSVVLDGSKNIARLKARIEASQIDYGKLLSERGLTDMASGKVDLMVDVSGNGGSVRQLMAGLNGRTRVVTENGRLESGALNI